MRPIRVFMRSIIMQVEEAFNKGCCFSNFTQDNIFVRRGQAIILGVKLVPHTDAQARENWRVIFNVLNNRQYPLEVVTVIKFVVIELQAKKIPIAFITFWQIASLRWMV